jgi:hypothetical protein
MTNVQWTLLPPMQGDTLVVWRRFPDDKEESRTVSSFTEDDPDYNEIMQLVAEGKLTIAPAE